MYMNRLFKALLGKCSKIRTNYDPIGQGYLLPVEECENCKSELPESRSECRSESVA